MDNFKKKWIKVQKDNNKWKWLQKKDEFAKKWSQKKEEFAKKFGTANTIIIEYIPHIGIKIWEKWNVKVTYNLYGIIPLSTVTFGKNLSKKEVENLKVPIAKILYKYNKNDIDQIGSPSYPTPNRCLL